jgi:hypothetical protein
MRDNIPSVKDIQALETAALLEYATRMGVSVDGIADPDSVAKHDDGQKGEEGDADA